MPAVGYDASWARSVRVDRYQAGSAMAPHHHHDAWLSVVVDGRYEERIRGRVSEHGPGDLLFYPAFEVHEQKFCAAGALKVLIAPSSSSLDFLGERLRLADAPYAQSGEIAELGLRMAAELQRRDDFSAIVVQGLVLETLGLFFRAAGRSAARELPWLRAAKAFIETHCLEAVSIDELARVVRRHPTHLSRAFRQAFGQTVGECIRGARVRRAAQLLASGRRPIGEIAMECGFCDQAHLSRSFKKIFGTTPGAYRLASR
jgi:AraC family transcriptional regulator